MLMAFGNKWILHMLLSRLTYKCIGLLLKSKPRTTFVDFHLIMMFI